MSRKAKRSNKNKGQNVIAKSTNLPNWIQWSFFVFGFLLYANTIPHDFTQDDAIVITENQYTQKGIGGIPGLLSKDTFFGFFKEAGKANLVSGGRYRPLTPVMFALEYQLVGASPWLGHLINAILYGLTGLLLFRFLLYFLPLLKFKEHVPFIAGLIVCIFLAHPLHTEVVANIKGRDEMMSFFLAMISLWAAIRYAESGRMKDASVSGIALFLAMLSKENAITFLAVVPLALFIIGQQKLGRLIKWTIPALLAALLFLIIRTSVLGLDFGGTPLEILNNPFLKVENNQYVPFTFGERSATIFYTLGKYIQLFVFPHPLTHDYYPRHIDIMRWSDWQVIISFVFYIGLIGSMVWLFRHRSQSPSKKTAFFGLAFFLITLSIVSNIIFPIGTNMSERFMYMPSFGLSLIVGVIIGSLMKKNSLAMWIIAGVILVLFSAKTFTRNMVWKDNYTIFLTDVNTSTRSAKLLNSVGGELISQANKLDKGVEKQNMIKEAQPYLKKALEIHPNYKLAYLLLGNSHYYLEEYDQAIAMYRQTIKLDDQYRDGNRNLGIALRDGGKARGEKLNDPQGALTYLLEAEKQLPNDSETMRLLGVCYGRLGQSQKAIDYFEKELSLAPNNASTYFNLGIAYQNTGNLIKAQEYFEKAKSIDPDILNRNR